MDGDFKSGHFYQSNPALTRNMILIVSWILFARERFVPAMECVSKLGVIKGRVVFLRF